MDTIWLIRHAEKPAGDIGGVDENGAADLESLTPKGWERAGAWAVYFEGKVPTPTAIYASPNAKLKDKQAGIDDGSHSKRPVQTITPYADAVHTSLDQRFLKGEETALAAAVTDVLAARHGDVVVCWQHEDLPAIATALGATGVPAKWDGARFDMIWKLTRTAADKPLVLEPQYPGLLAGDLTHA
jgi:hypothetical protein